MTVPYTFATATSAIPLSQLDSNFATAVTLGSTALYLGNTTTTVAGLTLTSPTLTAPVLGTPASGNLSNCTGFPASGVTGVLPVVNGGTGVTTSTGSGNNVLSTSPTLVTPILGTPTSVTLTNATGLPLSTGVTGTLATTNGGTGLTSFTANGVVYASSTSALATGSALTFDGSQLVSGPGFTRIASAYGSAVANSGTLALLPGGGRAVGFLTVSAVNSSSANIRTQSTYSVFVFDNDNTVLTQIATANGSSGGSTFTLTWTNANGFIVTNTSGAARAITIGYMGNTQG